MQLFTSFQMSLTVILGKVILVDKIKTATTWDDPEVQSYICWSKNEVQLNTDDRNFQKHRLKR